MEFLSLQEAIVVAKRELLISDSQEHDDLLTFYGDEAIRHLDDPENTVTRRVELEVKDGNKVCLPRGFKTLVGFGHEENGCMCLDFSMGHDKCRDYFRIEGLWLIFNRDVDYDTVWVIYEGIGKDCDGFTHMVEEQERAVRAYIRWRYKAMYPAQYKDNPWKNDQQEYVAQKRYCKGITAQRKFRENKNAIQQILHGSKLRLWGGKGYDYVI